MNVHLRMLSKLHEGFMPLYVYYVLTKLYNVNEKPIEASNVEVSKRIVSLKIYFAVWD